MFLISVTFNCLLSEISFVQVSPGKAISSIKKIIDLVADIPLLMGEEVVEDNLEGYKRDLHIKCTF